MSCGTCDKERNGCDFCCGTRTDDGSCAELNPGGVFTGKSLEVDSE